MTSTRLPTVASSTSFFFLLNSVGAPPLFPFCFPGKPLRGGKTRDKTICLGWHGTHLTLCPLGVSSHLRRHNCRFVSSRQPSLRLVLHLSCTLYIFCAPGRAEVGSLPDLFCARASTPQSLPFALVLWLPAPDARPDGSSSSKNGPSSPTTLPSLSDSASVFHRLSVAARPSFGLRQQNSVPLPASPSFYSNGDRFNSGHLQLPLNRGILFLTHLLQAEKARRAELFVHAHGDRGKLALFYRTTGLYILPIVLSFV